MKTDRYIDDFIRMEQQTKLNPFLTTRVMAEIEKCRKPQKKRIPVWQVAVVAASITAVVFLGISIGNRYSNRTLPEVVMNINDSQIENLRYYNFTDDE